MRTLLFLIQKEFIQIARNKTMLPLIFIMPIVQLVILVYAADLNMKSIEYSVFDLDASHASRELLSHYDSSPFFDTQEQLFSDEDMEHSLKSGEADIVIKIPKGFEKSLMNNESVEVQFLVDGINNAAAVITTAYAQNILLKYHNNLGSSWLNLQEVQAKGIEIKSRHWFNPDLDFNRVSQGTVILFPKIERIDVDA